MDFFGVEVEACGGVYLPCDDTFMLAEAVMEEVTPGDRMLEVGTGTGAIALLAASLGAEVVATDVLEAAVRCAMRNARRNGLELRVVRCDLMSCLRGRFSLIAFNPPYLPAEEDEPKDEVSTAWHGGRDGREVVDRFIPACREYLERGGRVLMVQSSLSQPERSMQMFLSLGFEVSVVAERRFPFERLLVVRAVLP